MQKNKAKKTPKRAPIKETIKEEAPVAVEKPKEETKKEEGMPNPLAGIVWALLLIFLGVLFLLNNFGIVPWSVWGGLWRLWPLFIIFAGVQILIGKSKILNLIIGCFSFLILSAIILVVVSLNNSSLRDWVKTSFNVDLGNIAALKTPEEKTKNITLAEPDFENVETRDINLEITAGKFSIKEYESENYFEVNALYTESLGEPVVETKSANNNLGIQFKTEEKSFWSFPFIGTIKRQYDFSIGNRTIPTEIDLVMTAGDGSVVFDDLSLKDLRINMTAGNLEMDLGERAVPSDMSIKLTAGDMDLRLPEDIGLKVNYRVTAGDLKIDSENFDRTNERGTYESENYHNTTKTVTIDLEMTAGDITITTDN